MNIALTTQATNALLLSNQKKMNDLDFDLLNSKIKCGIIDENIAGLLTSTSHEVLLKLKLKNSTEDYLNFSTLLKDRGENFDLSVSESLDYNDSIIAKKYHKSASRLDLVSNKWVF